MANNAVVDRYYRARAKRDRTIRALLALPVGCWGAKDHRLVTGTWDGAHRATAELMENREAAQKVLKYSPLESWATGRPALSNGHDHGRGETLADLTLAIHAVVSGVSA
jgi:hypothetical protein